MVANRVSKTPVQDDGPLCVPSRKFDQVLGLRGSWELPELSQVARRTLDTLARKTGWDCRAEVLRIASLHKVQDGDDQVERPVAGLERRDVDVPECREVIPAYAEFLESRLSAVLVEEGKRGRQPCFAVFNDEVQTVEEVALPVANVAKRLREGNEAWIRDLE